MAGSSLACGGCVSGRAAGGRRWTVRACLGCQLVVAQAAGAGVSCQGMRDAGCPRPDRDRGAPRSDGEDPMVAKLGRTCFAGFLGTIVITCMVTFASPDLLGPADIATVLARMLEASWLAGMAMHLLVGTVALPAIYLVLIERWLPGGPA